MYIFARYFLGTYSIIQKQTASMNHRQTYSLWSAVLGTILCFHTACSEDAPDGTTDNQPIRHTLAIKGISFADAPAAEEKIDEVTIYQFSDGQLYKQQTHRPGQDGKTEISIVGSTNLYCIANTTLQSQDQTADESVFRKSVIASGQDSAPYFMSATTAVSSLSGNSETSISMKHGVARIDLSTISDPKIQIEEMIVQNAPAETYAFIENEPVSDNTVSYTKRFQSAFNGKEEAVFYIFESAKAVDVSVRGSYDGIPVRLQVQIPSVKRNKIYEIEILNAGATVEGSFEVKDWEEGSTVTGKPDTDSSITISAAHSTIPQTTSVDFSSNTVSVPAEGVAGLRLAFVADTRIDITSVEGLSDGVTISDMSVSDAPEGIVSAFDVSVPAQTNGRLGYSIFIHLRNALMSDSYDFVEIRVAPSHNQIETVEIGGSVWMAFNARSSDLEDQIYPLDGASVEDMYRYNWINTVGGLFQFGRKYMYTPWVGYNPSNNLGGQKQDIPWQSETHMPCPEGYRLPTRAELESIFPKGQIIPGSYVAGNGERITATLHTAEGTLSTPTGVKGSQIYVKFTSEDTGRYLIIPLAGGKGDKSTSNNPAFGKRAVLWTNSNQGCPGGYALAYWFPFEGNESTTIVEQRLQMEAFASVRCVKE